MAVKHTPGLWRVEEVNYSTSENAHLHNTGYDILGGDPERRLAGVYFTAYPYNPQANARLMAAAPELLEACSDSLQLLESIYAAHGDVDFVDVQVLAATLHAAINKAKGKD